MDREANCQVLNNTNTWFLPCIYVKFDYVLLIDESTNKAKIMLRYSH